MKMLIGSVGIVMVLTLLAPSVNAHTQLGTPLKKRYNLRSVSCTACHLKEKKERSKDDLTAFGQDIAKILEGKMVSERIAAAKEMDAEQRKAVLAKINKEYLEALDKLDKMKAASGKLYAEALPAGEIEGTKTR